MIIHKKKVTGFAKLLSILLSVLVLNLCISVPPPSKFDDRAVEKYQSGSKSGNRLLLQYAFDYLTGECVDMGTSSGSTLLEELNEVKEDWCFHVAESNIFLWCNIANQHPPHTPSYFLFLEDARLFPPPEFKA
jgi:hypothetical protein